MDAAVFAADVSIYICRAWGHAHRGNHTCFSIIHWLSVGVSFAKAFDMTSDHFYKVYTLYSRYIYITGSKASHHEVDNQREHKWAASSLT